MKGSTHEARGNKTSVENDKGEECPAKSGGAFSFFFFHRRVACLNVTGSFVVPCKRVQARLPTIVVFVLSSDSLFIVPFLRRGKIPPLLSRFIFHHDFSRE